MSLGIPDSTTDLFAKSFSPAVEAAASPTATSTSTKAAVIPIPSTSLGGILTAVLRDDPAIRKQMTPIEQSAIDTVIKNIGTPDEYGSAAEYVLRALPYVRSTYSAMDVVAPLLPSRGEIAILMRSRYI